MCVYMYVCMYVYVCKYILYIHAFKSDRMCACVCVRMSFVVIDILCVPVFAIVGNKDIRMYVRVLHLYV